jgi:subtilisin family serine protease
MPKSAGARVSRAALHPATSDLRALQLVGLVSLMRRTRGSERVKVALIDGPVVTTHTGLRPENIRLIGSDADGCRVASSAACRHGTFVAGILAGKRGTVAPAICPGCILLVRPLFAEQAQASGEAPAVHADVLAAAIVDVVDAGANVINLSAAIGRSTGRAERKLRVALDYAGRSGAVTIAATGNKGVVGGSVIIRHPWVIPVAACDLQGRPAVSSNLGASVGRGGLLAPGVRIASLSAGSGTLTLSGTSVAAPFVTGAIALLLSEFPAASSSQARLAVTQVTGRRRSTIVPPVLNAQASFNLMAKVFSRSREG